MHISAAGTGVEHSFNTCPTNRKTAARIQTDRQMPVVGFQGEEEPPRSQQTRGRAGGKLPWQLPNLRSGRRRPPEKQELMLDEFEQVKSARQGLSARP